MKKKRSLISVGGGVGGDNSDDIETYLTTVEKNKYNVYFDPIVSVKEQELLNIFQTYLNKSNLDKEERILKLSDGVSTNMIKYL